MCKKMTVAYGDLIGQRLVGWSLFNGSDYGFFSDKQVKAKLAAGDLVNGLKLGQDGEVTIDPEFNRIIMGKSGLTFSPFLVADEAEGEAVMNKTFSLVKVRRDKGGNVYEFITNRCGHEEYTEDMLKAMLSVMDMGGVRLEGDKLVVHPAVEGETPAPEGEVKESKGAVKKKEKAEKTEKSEGVG